jgi:hypothetical protein
MNEAERTRWKRANFGPNYDFHRFDPEWLLRRTIREMSPDELQAATIECRGKSSIGLKALAAKYLEFDFAALERKMLAAFMVPEEMLLPGYTVSDLLGMEAEARFKEKVTEYRKRGEDYVSRLLGKAFRMVYGRKQQATAKRPIGNAYRLSRRKTLLYRGAAFGNPKRRSVVRKALKGILLDGRGTGRRQHVRGGVVSAGLAAGKRQLRHQQVARNLMPTGTGPQRLCRLVAGAKRRAGRRRTLLAVHRIRIDWGSSTGRYEREHETNELLRRAAIESQRAILTAAQRRK